MRQLLAKNRLSGRVWNSRDVPYRARPEFAPTSRSGWFTRCSPVPFPSYAVRAGCVSACRRSVASVGVPRRHPRSRVGAPPVTQVVVRAACARPRPVHRDSDPSSSTASFELRRTPARAPGGRRGRVRGSRGGGRRESPRTRSPPPVPDPQRGRSRMAERGSGVLRQRVPGTGAPRARASGRPCGDENPSGHEHPGASGPRRAPPDRGAGRPAGRGGCRRAASRPREKTQSVRRGRRVRWAAGASPTRRPYGVGGAHGGPWAPHPRRGARTRVGGAHGRR